MTTETTTDLLAAAQHALDSLLQLTHHMNSSPDWQYQTSLPIYATALERIDELREAII